MSDKIIRFVFSLEVSVEFVNLANRSAFSRDYYVKVAGGTSSSMKNVSREQIRTLVIALPPLTEQRRIVANVNSLMALCDCLIKTLADKENRGEKLLNAVGRKVAL